MKQTTAPNKTPSPHRENTTSSNVGGTDKSQSAIFMCMAFDMSWRLAIVVLVPIIGGFELDKYFHTSPLLAIVGFVLAMAGMALVLWQMLQTVNNLTVSKKGKP